MCLHINILDGELKLVAASNPHMNNQTTTSISITNANSSINGVQTNKIPSKTDCNKMNKFINMSNTKTIPTLQCFDCSNGRLPGGAHKCVRCQKSAHIIHDSCSRSISKEEGHGEKRICVECLTDSSSQRENFIVENWKGQGENSTPKLNSNKIPKASKSIRSYLVRQSEIDNVELSGKKTFSLGTLKRQHLCEVTIATLVGKLVSSYPAATDCIKCTCNNNCYEVCTTTMNTIDVLISQPGDVCHLEQNYKPFFQEVQAVCSNIDCLQEDILQCDGIKTITKTPGEILFIELISSKLSDDTDVTRELKVCIISISYNRSS